MKDNLLALKAKTQNVLMNGFSFTEKEKKMMANCSAIALGMHMMAFASTNIDGEVKKVMTPLIQLIGSIFRWIGILLLVWGAGQLILAFKNDDADSKSRAITIIVVSVLLILFKSIANMVLGGTDAGIELG